MKLTTFTDYSLRVLMHLATAPEGRGTIAEIARAFDISENHLVKVAHLLGREGFLFNTRGRGGGLRLARPARDINVADVVRATEGSDAAVECFRDGNRCVIAPVCRLSAVLESALRAFYEVLAGFSVEDLVTNRAKVAWILHRQPPLQ